MAIEITSDTVVKILVRRGLETERSNALLTEGELGYSIDTRRLFIGDGYTLGGNPVGIKNFGPVTNKMAYESYMQPGDIIIESNVPYYFYDNVFNTFNPVAYSDPTSNTTTIEYAPDPYNSLRISTLGIGDGLAIDYTIAGSGDISYILNKRYGEINFDARYLSLCAASNSFYVGNVLNTKVKNNLNATLNVDDEIFVNDTNISPYQLQIYAKDPSGTANSLIQAVSGGFILQGKNSVGLLNGGGSTTPPQVQVSNNGRVTLQPNIGAQGYTNPGNLVYGVSRFLSSAYFDQNVWVAGTLSAATFVGINTVTSTTSSLSVFTNDALTDTLYVGNGNPSSTQSIVKVQGNPGTGTLQEYFSIKDNAVGNGGVVTINYDSGFNSNYSLCVSGSMGVFTPGARGSGSNRVDITTGQFNLSAGTVSLSSLNNFVLKSGTGSSSYNVDVQGNLRVTQDITAYFSDSRLKEVVSNITSPLDKISQLNGVYYHNNDKSKQLGIYTEGRKVGIIAQEVQNILPEAVKLAPFDTTPDGRSASGENYLTVQYDKLVPLLIEAVKELSEKVDQLQKKLET